MLLLSGHFARVDALLHLCAALLRLCCALRLRDAVEQLLHRDAEKLRQLQHRLNVRQRLAALPLGYGLVGYPEHGGQLLLGQAVLLAEGGDPPAHRAVLDHLACLLALRALRARGRFVESECRWAFHQSHHASDICVSAVRGCIIAFSIFICKQPLVEFRKFQDKC